MNISSWLIQRRFFVKIRYAKRVLLSFVVPWAMAAVLLGCKSFLPYSPEYESQKTDSQLQAIYDGTHSLVLQQVEGKANQYEFVTCLGSLQNLDRSSCVSALSSADGQSVEYAFVSKAELSSKELEAIDNLKRDLAREHMQEHGNFPEDLSIVTMGAMVGAVSGVAFSPDILSRIDGYIAEGKVLSAKELYASRAMISYGSGSRGIQGMISHGGEASLEALADLAVRFQDSKIDGLLRSQANQKWDELSDIALSMIRNKQDPSAHLASMRVFLQRVNYRSLVDGEVWLWEGDAIKQLVSLEDKALSSTVLPLSAVSKDSQRYHQAHNEAKNIKRLAKEGYYEKARHMWSNSEDIWLLSAADQVDVARDIHPYRYSAERLPKLKVQFSKLYQQATAMLDQGSSIYDIRGILKNLRELRYEIAQFSSVGEGWNRTSLSNLYRGLEQRALANTSTRAELLKSINRRFHVLEDLQAINRQLRQIRRELFGGGKTSSTAVVSKSTLSTLSSRVSQGGKMISVKPGKWVGQSVPYLGWAVGLVAGVGVVVAIVQSASSKTLTDLTSLNPVTNMNQMVASQISASVPFVPVSLYGEYWPSLTSLDPSVNLKVASVPAVVKTLALHVSLGNEQLAAEMLMCLPKKPQPPQTSASVCKKVLEGGS